jgi:hypothetical protein
MKVITKSDALALVKKYAEQSPENMPYACYVREGEAECIVGQILVNDLGADPDELAGAYSRFTLGEGGTNSFFASRGNDKNTLHVLPEVVFTDEAVNVLDYAQCIQDGRRGDIPSEPHNVYDSREPWRSANDFVQKYFA